MYHEIPYPYPIFVIIRNVSSYTGAMLIFVAIITKQTVVREINTHFQTSIKVLGIRNLQFKVDSNKIIIVDNLLNYYANRELF